MPESVRAPRDPHLLAVSMTGVKMGDRVAFVGCARRGRAWRPWPRRSACRDDAVAVVPDERAAARRAESAPSAGVLVDVDVALPPTLPVEPGVSTSPSSTTRRACSDLIAPADRAPRSARWRGSCGPAGASSSSVAGTGPASPLRS